MVGPLRRMTQRRGGYIEIAPRNVHRARIRPTVEKFRGQMGSDSEPRNDKGNPIDETPDDDLSPWAPGGLLVPKQSFPVLGPKRNTVQNPAAPKRDAKAPPATRPDSKAPRVDTSSYP